MEGQLCATAPAAAPTAAMNGFIDTDDEKPGLGLTPSGTRADNFTISE